MHDTKDSNTNLHPSGKKHIIYHIILTPFYAPITALILWQASKWLQHATANGSAPLIQMGNSQVLMHIIINTQQPYSTIIPKTNRFTVFLSGLFQINYLQIYFFRLESHSTWSFIPIFQQTSDHIPRVFPQVFHMFLGFYHKFSVGIQRFPRVLPQVFLGFYHRFPR